MKNASNRDWVEYIFNLLADIKGTTEPWENLKTSLVDLPVAPYKVKVLDRTVVYDFNDSSTFDDIIFTKEGDTIETKYAVSANQGRILKKKLDDIDIRVTEMEKEVGILSRNIENKAKSVMLNAKSGVINNLVIEGTTYQNVLGVMIGEPITNSEYINYTFYGDYFYRLDMTNINHSYNKPISLIRPNTDYKLVLDVIMNDSTYDVDIVSEIAGAKLGTIPANKIGRYILNLKTLRDLSNKSIINFVGKDKSEGSVILRFFMVKDADIIPEFVKDIDCIGEHVGTGYDLSIELLNEGNIEAYTNLSNLDYSKTILMNEECIQIPIKSLTEKIVLKGFEENTQYKIDFTFRKELSTDGDMFIYVAYTDGTEEVYSMLNNCEFKQYHFTTLPNKQVYFMRFINNGAQKGSLYFKKDMIMVYESNKVPSKFQKLDYKIHLNNDLHGLNEKYTDRLFHNGYTYVIEYKTKHLEDRELNNIVEMKTTDNREFVTYQINLTTSYGINKVIEQQYSICNKLPNIGIKVLSRVNNEGFYIENSGSKCYLYIRLRKFEGDPKEYINNLGLEFIIPSETYYDVLQTKIPPITFSDNVRFGTSSPIPAKMSFSINTDLVDNIKLINTKLNSLQTRLASYLDRLY